MSESEIELERTYTVPLTRAWIAPRYKRTARAVNVLREFAQRHMKSSEIKIDSGLNETLWSRGITRPPRRIKVKMTKDEDGLVTISLAKEVKAEAEKEEEEAEPKSDHAAESIAPEETAPGVAASKENKVSSEEKSSSKLKPKESTKKKKKASK